MRPKHIHICGMNKKPILITSLILVGTVLFSSCGTTNRFRIKSADYLEINKGQIQQVNKLADYRVETKKVKGTYENQTGYNVSTSRQSMENAKQFAIADAIEKAKCDFLVNPLYDLEVAGTFIKVTVEGYPASYTVFKTVENTTVAPATDTRSTKTFQDFYTPRK